MKRTLRMRLSVLLGIVILPIVIVVGILEYQHISYKRLPVLFNYAKHASWPADGETNVFPLTVGARIGKAPNGDPLFNIPGQANHNWVYRGKYPYWWTGIAWVTSKNGIKAPDVLHLHVSEIRVVAYYQPIYKASILASTKSTSIIRAFVRPWQNQHILPTSMGTGETINIELISPDIPGLGIDTIVERMPDGKAYLMASPGNPDALIALGPAFSRWIDQIHQAHSDAFQP